MIKKYVNYIVTMFLVSSFNPLLADDIQAATVAEEVNQLRNDINIASEQLMQTYLNDAEISGKKKEVGVRIINQVKINDTVIEQFLNDPEVSESKKSKLVQRLQKLVNEAKGRSSKKKEESVQAE